MHRVNAGGQWGEVEIGVGNADQFGECAAPESVYGEPVLSLTMKRATCRVAESALSASPASDVPGDPDNVSHGDASTFGAHFDNGANALVSQRKWPKAGEGSATGNDDMVKVACCSGDRAHQCVRRINDLGFIDFIKSKLTGTNEHQTAHTHSL